MVDDAGVLLGIASFGDNTAFHMPAVYSSIYHYRNFIIQAKETFNQRILDGFYAEESSNSC